MKMISPKNINIEYNQLEDITSVIEPGRGFGVDMDDTDNYADASQVTLRYNNFVGIENDLTNKDQSLASLNATDNYFDELKVNVNGVSKGEIAPINATWMNKDSFSIVSGGTDKFGIVASFQKLLVPDTYTITTTVTA
jgi:hypothetical protein